MKKYLLIAALFMLAGCDKKADGTPGSTENKVELTDDDLPVRADFTEEAESSITGENYKAELDKLAGEIDKE
jgi:hypothetical protein